MGHIIKLDQENLFSSFSRQCSQSKALVLRDIMGQPLQKTDNYPERSILRDDVAGHVTILKAYWKL